MNILLVGSPRVGKSTLLSDVVAGIEHKQGFTTDELVVNGVRTGFELSSAMGNSALLASVDSPSSNRVARYGVNLKELDEFIDWIPTPKNDDLLYIDEIGQMQLMSRKFPGLVRGYLDSPNPFIGTLTAVYEDSFTREIRTRADVEVIDLSVENRETVQARVARKIAQYVNQR